MPLLQPFFQNVISIFNHVCLRICSGARRDVLFGEIPGGAS